MLQQFTTTLIKISSLMAIITMVTGCRSNEPAPDPKVAARTVLVYMAANCNLGYDGYDALDVDEMRVAAKELGLDGTEASGGARLIIYHAPYRKTPLLREVTKDGVDILKTYDDNTLSSLDIERMREVIDDVKTLAPNDSYGLVLWSHGTTFRETPESRATDIEGSRSASATGSRSSVTPLSYGNDNGVEMKITSLAKALEGHHFDFIYCDICHAATVEVAYELRHATDYIVGSTTELDLLGMPYNLNVPLLLAYPQADLVGAASTTLQYYTDHPRLGCSMSVISTSALDDLASATKAIVSSRAEVPDDYEAVPYYRISIPCLVYDFGHYMRAFDAGPTLMSAWEDAFNRTVIYKGSTPTAFGFDMSQYTGLGSYIVRRPADAYYDGYYNQSWYKDVIEN